MHIFRLSVIFNFCIHALYSELPYRSRQNFLCLHLTFIFFSKLSYNLTTNLQRLELATCHSNLRRILYEGFSSWTFETLTIFHRHVYFSERRVRQQFLSFSRDIKPLQRYGILTNVPQNKPYFDALSGLSSDQCLVPFFLPVGIVLMLWFLNSYMWLINIKLLQKTPDFYQQYRSLT